MMTGDAQVTPILEFLFDIRRRRRRLQPQRVSAQIGEPSAARIAGMMKLFGEGCQGILRIARRRDLLQACRERGRSRPDLPVRRTAQAGACMTVPQALQVRCSTLEKKRAKMPGNCVPMS